MADMTTLALLTDSLVAEHRCAIGSREKPDDLSPGDRVSWLADQVY